MKQLLIILPLAVLTACDHSPPPPSPPRPALIMVAGVTAGGASMGLVGEIRPRYESAQGFRIDGKIVERLVDVGARVHKGQLLTRLDPADTGLAALAAQADVRAAEADQALAEAELDRQRRLYDRKFISRSALDIRETQFKAATARVQQARAQAALSGNQSHYAALAADRDGVITEIRAEPGQVVKSGEVVVRIAGTQEREAVVAVPESRMAGIAPGVPAEIRLWAARDKAYQGKVREVAPAADNVTRTFQVRVSIPDADAAVQLGMTAGVRFAGDDHSALLLPTQAVTQRNGQTVVWVVDAGNHQVQPRAVQAGAFREDGVLVTGGLAGGERVVIAGLHALVPGMVVRPVQSEPSP
jgi:membrane fusion protein, multidrug efflux system